MATASSSGRVGFLEDLTTDVDPTKITEFYWHFCWPPGVVAKTSDIVGKWLVFRKKDKLDETWHMIRKAVESGELKASAAKSSTALENPNARDKDVGVICVYTSEALMDEVGLQLVFMLKHNISYKSDEATRAGMYSNRGFKGHTFKTMYWNDGSPSLVRERAQKRKRDQN